MPLVTYEEVAPVRWSYRIQDWASAIAQDCDATLVYGKEYRIQDYKDDPL